VNALRRLGLPGVCGVVLLSLGPPACESSTSGHAGSDPDATARFGVFFGGQVQQRQELPFVLDTARQRQGFRVELSRPLQAPIELHWEISRPARRGSKQPFATPLGRVTELGSATLGAGQREFEHDVQFKPGDPLGLWNVRVVLGDRVLLDRAFDVYDSDQRRAAARRATPPDGGL